MQRSSPVGHGKAGGLELGEVERGEARARGHGAGGGGVVLLRADRADGGTVAVPELEHLAGDPRPAGGLPGAGAVVGPVRGRRARLQAALAVTEEEEDRAGHVSSEGEAAHLIVHHGHLVQIIIQVGTAVRQLHHGAYEVAPVSYDPRASQDVVPGAGGDGKVARGLGLAIDAQGRQRLVLVVKPLRPVEHVV